MHTILYARVSTIEQTIEHQIKQAKDAGYVFDEVITDEGVSGVSTRLDERPQGRRLFDLLRSGDVLVVRWIDRLGRNYEDVTHTIRRLLDKGVTIRTIINNMTFAPGGDPMSRAVRDALIGFMAAMGQAQAEASKEAQKAGIAHTRASDPTAYLGRKPTFDKAKLEQVLSKHGEGTSISQIARELGLSRSTVHRIIADPAAASAAVLKWRKAR